MRPVTSAHSAVPVGRPGLQAVLTEMATDGEVVHLERLPARRARHGPLAAPLPPGVAAHLAEHVPGGADGFWVHQARAVDLARDGQHLVIATGTASGKSLCYQVPIAAAAEESGGQATSLLVFPTKALAQDQLRSLAAYDHLGVVPVTYDGDTPSDARTWARRHATALLTNPDMLHTGLLPYHGRWATFLRRLRYVVIDELHVLRGVFGSHVAHVLRRLRRVCALYGAFPTFVFASATIGEPAALASELLSAPVVAVDDDGSPQGERLLAIWSPPPADDGIRVSSLGATGRLLAGFVDAGYRTIAFSRSRRGAELVAARARREVERVPASAVRPYRGGYLAAERREIEREMFSGRLLGVSATTALELGVDIGGLDVCLVGGFPGTIASFRQQIGRAGRAAQQSLAVLVAGDDALDRWYADHPVELVRRPPERAVVNPANPFVFLPQLSCAAFEVPLVPEDAAMWDDPEPDPDPDSEVAALAALGAPAPVSGSVFDDAVRELVLDDRLHLVNGRAVYAGRGSPAAQVSLRSGSGGEFRIVDAQARMIGTVDGARAFSTIHPGALYLHQGRQFRVERLDVEDRAAWVVPAEVDEYTQARTDNDVRILACEATTTVGGLTLRLGRVEVAEQVVAYQRKQLPGGRVLATEPLDLPPSRLVTRAFWYDVPDPVLEAAGLAGAGEGGGGAAAVPGTVHAAEHAGIGMLPLFTICDRWDVGGVSTARHAQSGLAMILIYDGYPGGAGIAELGFAAGERHARATLEAIRTCRCRDGCPSCVQSPKCGNGNEPLDKAGAVDLLAAALGVSPTRS